MKFLLDENVDHRLAAFLLELDHDIKTVGYDYPSSLLDRDVLGIAAREQRILITNDRGDFGELIFRRHLPHCGVILFRLKSDDADIHLKRERLKYILNDYADQLQHFIVVTAQRVRVRKALVSLPEKVAA